MIINGDCLIELKKLKENSVDSVCVDPPYGINFMNRKWDYDVPKTEVWAECLRVLKPGGHLLSFFGTRTYHRGVVRIEDAGFEIRDMVSWLYGSGFPKSLNIGKKIDQIQGNEREDLGAKPYINDRGMKGNKFAGGNYERIQLRETKGNSKYEGYGTALKPSNEPIVLARKPLSEKNIALNVLKWGTGGINIEKCRVGTEKTKTTIKDLSEAHGNQFGKSGIKYPTKGYKENPPGRFPANLIHDGSKEVVDKFPMTGKGSASGYNFEKGNQDNPSRNVTNIKSGVHFGDSGSASRFFKTCEYTEADRIYYVPKASKAERNAGLEGFEEKQATGGGGGIGDYKDDVNSASGKYGSEKAPSKNNHPTVKPIKLMQELTRLITPKGGTCLDPYMGSGTTGIACKKENFKFIGIEKDQEYYKIAEARINAGQQTKLI